jgi:excisionase family DNA binding protein
MNDMARPKAIEKLAPAAPVSQSHSSGDWWDERDWFDLKEMARRLHVSQLTVRRMIKRGDLFEPAHFGSGMIRFSEDAYRRWYRVRAGLEREP